MKAGEHHGVRGHRIQISLIGSPQLTGYLQWRLTVNLTSTEILRLTSASAWEMLGMLPFIVITRSGLKQLMSLMELTVIFVSVS